MPRRHRDDQETCSLPSAAAASKPPLPRAYLLVIGTASSAVFTLPPAGEVVLGRAPSTDLCINDDAASRRHARVRILDGQIFIVDLNSHNGTQVNDQRLTEERRLVSGDVVRIGTTSLVVHAPDALPPTLQGSMERPDPPSRLQIGERTILIGDAAMANLYDLIRRLARSDLPVLIIGETGTGKENAAYAVHHFSPRQRHPLLSLNCATLPESLAESELFGHERGSFSGAVNARAGRFAEAHLGTLFFDEIGELPLGIQAKLLRVLETGSVTRLGESRERPVDVRIVAATNRDLESEVRAGRFRQDLFFRLNTATIMLPPLRERQGEIAMLARAFLADACRRMERSPMSLAPETMRRLLGYHWPGNVRELKNLIDYAAVTVRENVVEPRHLPARLLTPDPAPTSEGPPGSMAPSGSDSRRNLQPLYNELKELERHRILEALEATGGVQTQAAKLLGMPLRTFVAKLKLYGLRDV